MHQQLDDAYVSKYYLPVIESMIEENNKLGLVLRQQLLDRANGELRLLQSLVLEAQLHVVAANALADRPIVDCAFPKVDPGTALTNEMISDTVTRAQTCILDFEHGYYSMNVGDAG